MTDWQLRPARDHGLSLPDRLRSHNREPGLLSAATHGTWGLAVRAYLSVFHRLVVEGRENLPAKPPYVMVGNHCSHLDALTLGAALPRAAASRAYSLAAGDVFFGTLATSGFAALAINALPVWRKATSAADLALLRERLAGDGLVFILFPEGTRSRTGEMGRFRPGIGSFRGRDGGGRWWPCYLHGGARGPGQRPGSCPGRGGCGW